MTGERKKMSPQIGKVEAAYMLFFMAGVLTGSRFWYAIGLEMLGPYEHHAFVDGRRHD